MTASRLAWRVARRRVVGGGAGSALTVGLVAVAVAVPTVAVGDLVGHTYGRSTFGDAAQTELVGPASLALVFVVILTALASGEQLRLRTVGLWVCNGSRRRQRHVATALEGLLIGAIGTAVGLLVGGLVRYAVASSGDAPSDAERVLSAGDLAVVGGLGLGSALVASLIAGVRAGRAPTLTLLAARRPARRPRPVGLGLAALAVVGGTMIAAQPRDWIGMLVSVPVASLILAGGAAYLGSAALALLGPIGGLGRGAVRLALRGLARERYRTGPVAGLIAVVCGVAFVAALLAGSFHEREDRRQAALAATPRPPALHDDQVLVKSFTLSIFSAPSSSPDEPPPVDTFLRARALLPPGTVTAPLVVATVAQARFPASTSYKAGSAAVGIGDVRFVRALGLDSALAGELARGRAIVLNPRLVSDGVVTASVNELRLARFPVAVTAPGRAAVELPGVIISPQVAQRHSLDSVEVGTLLRAPQAMSPDVVRKLEALNPDNPLAYLATTTTGAYGRIPPPPGEVVTPGPADEELFGGGALDDGPYVIEDRSEVTALAAAGGGAVLVLVVAAIALSSAGRRSDDVLFAVLGARPTLRRWFGAVQALVLVLVGAGLAVGLGTVATAIGFASFNAETDQPPIPLVYPWAIAVGLLVVLPLAAATLSWLCTPAVRRLDLRTLGE